MLSKPQKKVNTGSILGVAGICAGTIFAVHKLLGNASLPGFSLHDKTVLLTGGSRGFGLTMAREFGSRGARLALTARDGTELQRACDLLAKDGIEARAFTADLTKPDEINSLLEQVIGHFGSIDVLVNNAGHISVGSLDSFTHQDYEDAMNLMFWAPVNLTFAVLPHMRSRQAGRIVNITSIGGRVSIPHLLPYSCAKFAFVGFSTGLGAELKRNRIEVLTVVPGLMRTGSYLNAEFKGAAKEEFAWFGILGNLPGFSVAADYAAASVRVALETGQQICTISLPAKVLAAIEGFAPEVNRTILGLADRFVLPYSNKMGSQSGKALNPSLNALFQGLTQLGKLAAVRLNEF
ncbi:MAG: SDR family NAD(P)-dependent oxidoreductase [Acidobacteriaceae bacterium]|nr:SDR family NAD(P)-dependent oxidoreductase [Acidobacteriaceae bacterium]